MLGRLHTETILPLPQMFAAALLRAPNPTHTMLALPQISCPPQVASPNIAGLFLLWYQKGPTWVVDALRF